MNRIRSSLVLAFLLAALLCAAQTMRITVAQLKAFVKSAIELHQPDNKLAAYLKNVKLTDKLTDGDVEEMIAGGLGPRASEAVSKLRDDSKSLPDAPKPKAAPPPPPPAPGPSSVEQGRIIQEARDVALNYSKRLPDFICLQVTRRYYDQSGLENFALYDTVASRLSYFEQKEDYKVISVNGNLSQVDYNKLGGAISSGEFGTMLREIFEPETEAEFWWERWGKLRGKVCHVFGYKVRQDRSRWKVVYERSDQITPGYHGLVYIDRDSPIVLRITMEADSIPPTFPIQEARDMLDYDWTEISGSPFLLPLRSEMRMREGKFLVKNQAEFRSYRKYGADVKITFDEKEAEPLPDDKTKEEAVPPPPAQPPR